MSNFSELVREFGKVSGLGDLALAEGSVCRLVFDGDLTLDLELAGGGKVLLVAATVATSVEELGDDVFALSMQLNADVARSGGAFLAHDAAADDLLLIRRLEDTGMRYDEFEALLKAVIEHGLACRLAVMERAAEEDDFDVEADDDDADEEEEAGQTRDTGLSTGMQHGVSEGELVFRL